MLSRVLKAFIGRFSRRAGSGFPDGGGKDGFVERVIRSFASVRSLIAPTWRKTLRTVLVLIGLALFVAAELYMAQSINSGSQEMLILMGGAIGFILLAFFAPLAAFCFWLLFTPFLTVFHINIQGYYFDNLALSILMCLTIFRMLANKYTISKPLFAEILILLTFVQFSMPALATPVGATLGLLGKFMIVAAAPFTVYLILKSVIQTQKHLYILCVVIVVLGLIWAISGFYEHFTGYTWYSLVTEDDYKLGFQDIGKGRATGPGGSYTIYGLVLMSGFAFALHLVGCVETKAKRAFYYISMAIIAVGLYFGYSKGAYGSLILFILLMLFLSRGRRKQVGVLAIGLLLVVATQIPRYQNDAQFRNRMDLVSGLAGRAILHRTAIQMVADNFWVGVGRGNFSQMVPKYMIGNEHFRNVAKTGLVKSYSRPHSEYLAVFSENGILGMLTYYGGFLCFLILLFRMRARLPSNGFLGSNLACTIIAWISCVLLVSYNDEFYKYPYTYNLMVCIFVIAVRMYDLTLKKSNVTREIDKAAGEAPDLPTGLMTKRTVE